MWPEGFEFPACKACNSRSSRDEQVLAYYATLGDDGRHETSLNALKGLKNNSPHLLPRLLTGIEKRPLLRTLGIEPTPGHTVSDIPLIAVPEEARRSVLKCLTKLTCALVYREMNMVAPSTTLFWAYLRSNAELLLGNPLSHLPFRFDLSVSPTVQRRDVGHIFRYEAAIAADRSAFAATYTFGAAFVGFGCAVLDASVAPKSEDDDDYPWTDSFGVPIRQA
jgi:hypothetical protein